MNSPFLSQSGDCRGRQIGGATNQWAAVYKPQEGIAAHSQPLMERARLVLAATCGPPPCSRLRLRSRFASIQTRFRTFRNPRLDIFGQDSIFYIGLVAFDNSGSTDSPLSRSSLASRQASAAADGREGGGSPVSSRAQEVAQMAAEPRGSFPARRVVRVKLGANASGTRRCKVHTCFKRRRPQSVIARLARTPHAWRLSLASAWISNSGSGGRPAEKLN